MSDFIKLDDAISAIGKGALIFASSTLNISAAMLSAFGEIKKADVVEVVRCKDCKNAIFAVDGADACVCAMVRDSLVIRDRDFFCAFGERRADNGVS